MPINFAHSFIAIAKCVRVRNPLHNHNHLWLIVGIQYMTLIMMYDGCAQFCNIMTCFTCQPNQTVCIVQLHHHQKSYESTTNTLYKLMLLQSNCQLQSPVLSIQFNSIYSIELESTQLWAHVKYFMTWFIATLQCIKTTIQFGIPFNSIDQIK